MALTLDEMYKKREELEVLANEVMGDNHIWVYADLGAKDKRLLDKILDLEEQMDERKSSYKFSIYRGPRP
jgi:hypothetical protein